MIETNDFSGVVRLPVIALRGKVLFPKTLLNFDVARKMSINAVNTATEMHTDNGHGYSMTERIEALCRDNFPGANVYTKKDLQGLDRMTFVIRGF